MYASENSTELVDSSRWMNDLAIALLGLGSGGDHAPLPIDPPRPSFCFPGERRDHRAMSQITRMVYEASVVPIENERKVRFIPSSQAAPCSA